jgi:CheY-like chemotaxis protein
MIPSWPRQPWHPYSPNEASITSPLPTRPQEAIQTLGVGQAKTSQENNEFDLILLDIVMPDMDGIKACSLIKGVDRLRDVPVIMTTGRTDFESLREAFEAGAMDYLTKPINEVELMARVNSALALKAEIDQRKAREKQLLDMTTRLSVANKELKGAIVHGRAHRAWPTAGCLTPPWSANGAGPCAKQTRLVNRS